MMALVSFLKRYGLLLGILVLALVLRAVLIPYGLPLLFHEDEPIYYRRALQFGFGDWDPHYFKKPTFFLYFYFGFYYLFYLFSDFYQWQPFYKAFWQDPTRLALLGRSITVCFSVASVWLSYRLGKRALSKTVGLAAAFLLAIDFTHVKYSPIVISDIPALFCVLGTAWFAFSIFEKGRWRDYLCCAAAIALAMSFKYNAFCAFFLLAGHILYSLRHNTTIPYRSLLLAPKLWGAFATIALLFIGLNPYTLINLPTFLADLNLERQHMLLRTPTITTRSYSFMIGFDNIFFQILPKALGWPLYGLGLLGLVFSFLGYTKASDLKKTTYQRLWILLSFPLGFLLVVSQFRLVNAKYLLPLLPFWFMLAAYSLQCGLSYLQSKKSHLITAKSSAALYAFLLISLSSPIWKETIGHVRLYSTPDTRTEARHYLDQYIPEGTTLYTEPQTLPIEGLTSEGVAATFAKKTMVGHYQDIQHLPVSLDTLQQKHPDFILLLIKPRKGKGSERVLPYPPEYYSKLAQEYHLIKLFIPYPQTASFPSLTRVSDFLGFYQGLKKKYRTPAHPGPFLMLFERNKPQAG